MCVNRIRITKFEEGDNNMKIYVGNLSYEVTEEDLRQEFGAFGEVASANIISDKYSGRSKGFAFVEMATKSEAEAAITSLNGKMIKDRTVVVNEARPRTDNRSGGYRGGGSGGFGGRQRRY